MFALFVVFVALVESLLAKKLEFHHQPIRSVDYLPLALSIFFQRHHLIRLGVLKRCPSCLVGSGLVRARGCKAVFKVVALRIRPWMLFCLIGRHTLPWRKGSHSSLVFKCASRQECCDAAHCVWNNIPLALAGFNCALPLAPQWCEVEIITCLKLTVRKRRKRRTKPRRTLLGSQRFRWASGVAQMFNPLKCSVNLISFIHISRTTQWLTTWCVHSKKGLTNTWSVHCCICTHWLTYCF